MAPPLTEEYIDLSETTRAKYGDRSLVFLQCGGFYEAYDMCDATRSHPLGICERDLHLKVVQRSNGVYAAGVPIESISRYRAMLLEKGCTLVIVDQIEGAERQVTAVVSPGFDDDASESSAGAILVVDTCAHVARYDVQTNRLDMRVAAASTALLAIEAARQCLYETGRCTEIEVHLDTSERIDESDIAARFPSTALHVRDVRALGRRRYVYNEAWQRRCLESHFGRHVAFGACIFEKLGLHDASPAAVAALIFLVNFVRDHNPTMLDIIPVPNRNPEADSEVKLLHGIVDALNIMHGSVSIFGILGEDIRTHMGDAALRARLCRPTSDIDVLTVRYDEIEAMQTWRRELVDDDLRLDTALRGARNLTKLACRARRGILRMHEVEALIETHRCAKDALSIGSMVLLSVKQGSIAALSRMIALCDARFDVEGEYGIARDDGGDVLRKRRACRDAMLAVEKLQSALDATSSHGPRAGARVRLVGGPSSGYQLHTTPSRAKMIQEDNSGYTFASVNATTVRVTNDEVVAALDALATARCAFDECCTSVFESTCAMLNADYFGSHAEAIARAVGELDAVRSLATAACRCNLRRPSLDGERAGGAFSSKALRHPIIEKLVDARGCAYVSNDVIVNAEHSVLVYGVNSVGKSSLLKATACAILMAQAGAFVAAAECTLTPYRAIAMHIGGADDMYRAQSSFVREVEQLRTVLRASRKYGPRVLFLADELGNTTEDTSATKIVASLLHTLYTRGASLFVATHMFALQDNAVVSGLVGLKNHHLAVEFTETGGIRFDRTLKIGLPSVREYGCRIAEHLIVDDPAFVTLLRSERHCANDRFGRMRRPSRYNRNLFAEACSICDYRPKTERELPIAWHHIEGQCTANDGVVASGLNVHASANLMPVCQACHQDIHRGWITVHGYIETAAGRELRFQRTTREA